MEYYFIAANTGLGTELGKEEIEAKIQTKLDDMTNCNVKVEYKRLESDRIRLIFWRDDLLKYSGKSNIIPDTDMAIVLGIHISAFRPEGMDCNKLLLYPLSEINGRCYTHKTAFIRLYRVLMESVLDQSTEDINIRVYGDRIVLDIKY